MKLEFGDNNLLTIKKKCDKEYKMYKPVSKRKAFFTAYNEVADSSEFFLVNQYVGGVIEDARKEKKNPYEAKRLKGIANDVWSNYVGCILRKKYFLESYTPFTRTDLYDNKLF